MKKILSLVVCVLAVALCSSLASPVAVAEKQVSLPKEKTVALASQKAETSVVNEQEVLAARFLNMLNHNYAYNEDFESVDALINQAAISLYDLREGENGEFIKELFVKDYIKNMYGIEIADMSGVNAEWPRREGYVYIIPRCVTVFEHELVSVTKNEDGTFTVITEVEVDNEMQYTARHKVVSLFVKNDASSFGYNLIYSDRIENGADM